MGAGTYNTVFKCKNSKGKDVACKVVLAHSNDLNEEFELENERKNITNFATLSIDKKSEEIINKIAEKDDKWRKFKKYSNIPKLKFDDIVNYDAEFGKVKFHCLIAETPLMASDILNAYSLQTYGGFEEIRRMGKAVLKVLIPLHSKNRAHLDIKPGNILQKKIDGNKTRYNLADFGLSVDGNIDKLEGRPAGTPGFASPDVTDASGYCIKPGVTIEQLQKCDIYALGVSLFEFYLMMLRAQFGKPINFDMLRSNYYKDRRKLLRTYYEHCAKYSEYFPQEYTFLSLIRKMMATKHEKRPTAEKCLQDAFFSKPPPPTPAFSPTYTYGSV